MKKSFAFSIMVISLISFLVPGLYSQSRDDFPEFENVKKVAQAGYQFLKIDPLQ